MKRMIVVFAVLLSACMTSSSPMAGGSADVDAAIRAQVEAFEARARARDTEGVAGFYADDAVLMPPNAMSVSGRANIGKFWGAMLAAPSVAVDLIPEDVQSCGDLAVERGRYEFTSPIRDSGKYIVVWRNRGGRWQIVTDMFSSNLPMPGSS